jgi:hypothetical protein
MSPEVNARRFPPPWSVDETEARILVVKGASREFNPSLPQSVIDRAMNRDPIAASAEYLAEFRSADAESFITRAAVQACVVRGRLEADRAKVDKRRCEACERFGDGHARVPAFIVRRRQRGRLHS